MECTAEDIRQSVKSIILHHQHGFWRIITWYQQPGMRPHLELSQAPHVSLMKSSFRTLKVALSGRYSEDKLYHPDLREIGVWHTLVGTGTEILMKGILLKFDPEFFIRNSNFNIRTTISYSKTKKHIVGNILPTVEESPETRQWLIATLDMIEIQRNNAVHLAYHSQSGIKEDSAIFNGIHYLYATFFPEESKDFRDEIIQWKEERKAIPEDLLDII